MPKISHKMNIVNNFYPTLGANFVLSNQGAFSFLFLNFNF